MLSKYSRFTGETGALCGAVVGLVQSPPSADDERVEVGGLDVDGGV